MNKVQKKIVSIGGGGFTHQTDESLDDFVLNQSDIKNAKIGFLAKSTAVAMEKHQKDSETDLEILRNIEANPKLTQRQIAKDLGMSLGKTNYLIQALLKRGFVKVNNFKTSGNKLGYLYLLTPEGIEAKRKLTMIFLLL